MSDEADIMLAPTAVLAEAARILAQGQYHIDRAAEKLLDLPDERAFVAEDKYGVVVVVVYDTWNELARAWREAQARAVSVISDRFSRLDRKAWDGYLVLLTPALAAHGEETVHEIRYDTTRIRKIVATGEELRSLSDVERALLPLLPLAQEMVAILDGSSPLDELPDRLEHHGVKRDLVDVAVQAFKDHRPIVQELQRHITAE